MANTQCHCHACNGGVVFDDSYTGQNAQCPHCGQTVLLQASQPPSQSPVSHISQQVIQVFRDNKPIGQFSLFDCMTLLAKGQLLKNDLAYVEGMQNYSYLSDLVRHLDPDKPVEMPAAALPDPVCIGDSRGESLKYICGQDRIAETTKEFQSFDDLTHYFVGEHPIIARHTFVKFYPNSPIVNFLTEIFIGGKESPPKFKLNKSTKIFRNNMKGDIWFRIREQAPWLGLKFVLLYFFYLIAGKLIIDSGQGKHLEYHLKLVELMAGIVGFVLGGLIKIIVTLYSGKKIIDPFCALFATKEFTVAVYDISELEGIFTFEEAFIFNTEAVKIQTDWNPNTPRLGRKVITLNIGNESIQLINGKFKQTGDPIDMMQKSDSNPLNETSPTSPEEIVRIIENITGEKRMFPEIDRSTVWIIVIIFVVFLFLILLVSINQSGT